MTRAMRRVLFSMSLILLFSSFSFYPRAFADQFDSEGASFSERMRFIAAKVHTPDTQFPEYPAILQLADFASMPYRRGTRDDLDYLIAVNTLHRSSFVADLTNVLSMASRDELLQSQWVIYHGKRVLFRITDATVVCGLLARLKDLKMGFHMRLDLLNLVAEIIPEMSPEDVERTQELVNFLNQNVRSFRIGEYTLQPLQEKIDRRRQTPPTRLPSEEEKRACAEISYDQ